jgi:ribosomal protein S18 acetylase RimI-like enzyme
VSSLFQRLPVGVLAWEGAVKEDTIEEAVRTERKGFADSEAGPDADELRHRLTLFRAEMGGQGSFLLARVAGEPASVVGFYEGEDRFIHHLATRVPFRRRGIASRLLSEVLAGARERGCRSTIISAAENGRPVGLYRSLGFTDEIYWRREYKHVGCRAVARKAFACPPVEALRTESSSVRLPTWVPPAVPWLPACAAPPNRPTLSPTYYLLRYRVVRTMLQRRRSY